MLFNNSPLKNTSDKLKSPQASIKTIKFERKKDYKAFLKFIERESKALKEIKLPSLDEEKNKKSSLIGSILGLGGLGLLALFGGGGDDGDPNDQPNKLNSTTRMQEFIEGGTIDTKQPCFNTLSPEIQNFSNNQSFCDKT